MTAPLRLSAVLVALAGLALCGPPTAAAATDIFVSFGSPSHGIGCLYSRTAGEAPLLRCDVRHVERPAPRPASCELDYGSAFGLTATGRARRLCAGDTALDPKARVLPYGAARRLGPFLCVSRRTGMRCTTRAGHGFELSRARQRLF